MKNEKEIEFLKNLSSKLNEDSYKIYEVLIKQGKIEGVSRIIKSIFCITGLIIQYKVWDNFLLDPVVQKELESGISSSSTDISVVILILIGIATLSIFFDNFRVQKILTCIINPEFYAIENLFKSVQVEYEEEESDLDDEDD